MSKNKRGRAYRIVVILLVYLFLGAAIFAPLSAAKNHEVLIYILLAVYGVALIATVLVTEIRIALKAKKAAEANE